MSIEIKVDPARKLIECTASGPLQSAELRENRANVLQHPEFDQEFSLLYDCRGVTEAPVSGDEIRLHGFTSTAFARTALVAGEQDFMFGLLRMYELNTAERPQGKLRVFRNYDEAVSWLESSD
jgi:hypothetical protein